MRKTILTLLVALLFAASTAQMAAAAERHHVRKIDRATSERFRNANNAVVAPAQPRWYPNYSDYSEGHMNMVGH